MTKFWVRKDDKRYISREIIMKPYTDRILTGDIDGLGLSGQIAHKFKMGKRKIWVPPARDFEYYFIRIDNSLAYPQGLILFPDNEHAETFCKRLEEHKSKSKTIPLVGNDSNDFVARAFATYYGPKVAKSGKDYCLLLYNAGAASKPVPV